MIWPPNYSGELARRMEIERTVAQHPELVKGARELYASSPVLFISDCVWLYEPRAANRGEPTRLPAVPFKRQIEFIEWMWDRVQTQTSAPVEKSRDSGATWIASAFAVWLWLFHPGSTVGFGSRKEILVDRNGDLNSIFEKIRSIIKYLPPWLLPQGWNPKFHSNYMRIINPENDSSIVGEAGDNIGRGGRATLYVVDESAFLERPQLVDAALSATTDCRIDISSPRAGTIFNAWCAANPHKFIFDVSDAPWHTAEWLKQKQTDAESKGLGHLFRQEFLRDSTAGIEGQLIKSDWVEAAIDAHVKLGIKPTGVKRVGLDVADGGMDRSAFAKRHGIVVLDCRSRGDALADEAGRWAYGEAELFEAVEFLYDSIGVGAGAAAALRDKRKPPATGWSAAGAVLDPTKKYEGNRTNEDMFANAKAQAWWLVRDRFIKTFRAVREGRQYDPDELISLSSEITELRELKTELSQVVYKHNPSGKVLIDKAPDGHPSPNRADSVIIAMAPKPQGIRVLGTF